MVATLRVQLASSTSSTSSTEDDDIMGTSGYRQNCNLNCIRAIVPSRKF